MVTIFVFDGYRATILSVFEYDVDIEFKNIDRKLVGDPFFLEFGYFPVSNFTKAPDQRTPPTESDTNKER